MKWDAVERELYVVGNQLQKLGESFQVLAAELCRERSSSSVSGIDKGAGPMKPKRTRPPGEGALPF